MVQQQPRLLLRNYDPYQRLQLQFYVLLMMGAMYTRNMWSDFAVNKYLHTVASCWILLKYSCDARNHEYKFYTTYLLYKRLVHNRSNYFPANNNNMDLFRFPEKVTRCSDTSLANVLQFSH